VDGYQESWMAPFARLPWTGNETWVAPFTTGSYNQADRVTPDRASCLTRPESCEPHRLPWQGLRIEPARIEQHRGRASRCG
jgi:hypothetical protein